MIYDQPYLIRVIQKQEAAKANLFMKENNNGQSALSIQGCYQHAAGIFVCETQGNWLGLVVSYPSPHSRGIAVIETVVVKESSRRQGIATAVLSHTLEFWRQQCIFRFSYMTENKTEAIDGLLQKLQFKPTVESDFVFYTLKLLPDKICVHNRVMRPSMNTINGEVSEDTLFEYFQKDDVVWGTYSGGNVVRGVLIGKMAANGNIDFKYQQLSTDGELYSGHSKSTTEFLNDGRIVLYEDWEWTGNRQGGGRSVIEEIKE